MEQRKVEALETIQMKKLLVLCSISLFMLFLMQPQISFSRERRGNIAFQPSIIEEVQVSFVEEFFRFRWLDNRFDLKLTFGYNDTDRVKELSLKDYWEKTDHAMKWKEVLARADAIEFGYNITDIPSEVSNRTLYLKWKIEDANFEPYIDTVIEQIYLPDNLMMSYQDLYEYGFTVTYPNNHTAYIANVTGKTSLNLDPITWSTPTLTVIGTYNSEANWYVWNASNVNGWGAVFNYDNMTYFYNSSKLVVGDGSTTTTFVDEKVQMCFNTTNEIAINVKAKATFQLGNLEDAVNYVTSGGCHVLFDLAGGSNDVAYYAEANSDTNIYGSIIESQSHQSNFYVYHETADAEIYESVFSGTTIRAYLSDLDLNRVTQTGGDFFSSGYGLYSVTAGTFEDIKISGNQYTMLTCYGTFTNFKAYNYTYLNYLYHASHDTQYLINPDVDLWEFKFTSGYTKDVYRQYTFDLAVTFQNNTAVNGATVTLTHYGQTETEDYTGTTDANGEIPQQTLTMGTYNFTGGNTIYSYNPYNINITYSGFQPYIKNFTLSEQTEWTIALQTEQGKTASWYLASLGIGCVVVVLALFVVWRMKS